MMIQTWSQQWKWSSRQCLPRERWKNILYVSYHYCKQYNQKYQKLNLSNQENESNLDDKLRETVVVAFMICCCWNAILNQVCIWFFKMFHSFEPRAGILNRVHQELHLTWILALNFLEQNCTAVHGNRDKILILMYCSYLYESGEGRPFMTYHSEVWIMDYTNCMYGPFHWS